MIMAAPWIAAGLLLIGAVPAWWFRGHSAKSEMAGLRAQIAACDAQLSAEASPLALARDQLGAQAEDLARARPNLETLESSKTAARLPARLPAPRLHSSKTSPA